MRTSLLALLLVFVCPACHDVDSTPLSDGGAEDGRSLPGFGESREAPVGARFALPKGVGLVGPIPGYTPFAPEACAPEEEAVGSGDLVRVCLTFENSTTDAGGLGHPVDVVLPERLVFVSESLSTQNGILVQRTSFTVWPGTTLRIPVYLYCVNDSRSASEPSDRFRLGPVVDYPAFVDLTERLADKTLEKSGQAFLQAIVWNLAGGATLTDAERARLDSLPSRGTIP